jgi:hypothetical protein
MLFASQSVVGNPGLGLDGEVAAQRRRSPLAAGFAPPPAAYTHSWPPDRDPMGQIQSNGSRSSRLESSQSNPAGPGNFAKKAPEFFVIHENTLPP